MKSGCNKNVRKKKGDKGLTASILSLIDSVESIKDGNWSSKLCDIAYCF